ncbi:hypothetical protein DQ238_20325 [Geodermatophilus sp. TF02-6]|uniref:DUF4235 domain-containing protein n=1 Tax=Geodermatophilus sp. TF02-6 TaxID=2250575 RepID=UPI000DEB054B|nr:DUF4235 domain-containing protein [Geodermatophilus sp. TF02-6]RBY75072.1 hypothetical protein DQ238_20325 [Geodermatophilus sp. TF02-6]
MTRRDGRRSSARRRPGTGSAVPTGFAVRGTPPPEDSAAPGVGWGAALAWAAVSGVVVAAGRLVAARARRPPTAR